jgi:hypothetical protein
MGERITRRDYLNSTLVASGSVLLGAANPLQLLAKEDWDGYGGVGDYKNSNGNTHAVMSQGTRSGIMYTNRFRKKCPTPVKLSTASW